MTVGHNIRCSMSDTPTFEVPEPADWPSLLDSNKFIHPLYHHYHLSEPLNSANPDCVLKKLIQNPTPGKESKAATTSGTLNNAIALKINNFVTSYLTLNWKNNKFIIVNTAAGGLLNTASPFGPGYVVRWVDNDYVHTAGEGTSLIQSKVFGAASMTLNSIANYLVWQTQMQDFVKECECKK